MPPVGLTLIDHSRIHQKLPAVRKGDRAAGKAAVPVIDFIRRQRRRTLREARKYEETFEKMIAEEERPAFHLSPRTGWMNDPNGFWTGRPPRLT